MRWPRRFLRREDGFTIAMALAFLALAVPVVTAALGLASTLSIDSRVKSDLTKQQFSAIGANEYALDLLEDDGYLDQDSDGDGTPDIWEDNDGDGEPDGDEFTVPLNDDDATVEITPDHPAPLTPPDGEGLVVTKIVVSTEPAAIPANSSETSFATYGIEVANNASRSIELKRVFDGLPMGFEYKGPSYLCQGNDCIEINDPNESQSVTIEPQEQQLYFEEGDSSQGIREMLTWNLFEEHEIILQPGESVSLRFKTEFEDLDEGYYCNYSWVEPEGSQTRTHLTARVAVGNPAGNTCVGEEIYLTTEASATLNPDEDPSDPDDDVKVTYTITVENGTGTDLNIWWIRDKLPPGFSYTFGTTSGSTTQSNPFTTVLYGRQRLNWFFIDPNVAFPAQSVKTLEFEATAPRAAGLYRNEVWIFYNEYEDDDATYSWPAASVMLADLYNVKVNGKPASKVWVTDDETIAHLSYLDP